MNLLQLLANGAPAPATNIEDVFSAYTYTGNGSTQTITNGVDLTNGMVWIKSRSNAVDHEINDSVRGWTKVHHPNTTDAQYTADRVAGISTGFNLTSGAAGETNFSPYTYVSWSFAQANNFFHVSSNVKAAGVDKTVDLSALGTVGMVAVKRTDAVGSWYVFHRSCTAGKLLYLEQTAAEATLGHITVSGTTLTLEDGVIADGTYIVYAWAHDDSDTGLIQCGSYSGTSAAGNVVTLGFEPQWVMIKEATGASTGGWFTFDNMRGMPVGGVDAYISANASDAEASPLDLISPTATGFNLQYAGGSTNTTGRTYIYLAIRRGPMALPTVGTQVYNANLRSPGSGATTTITGVGFPPDLAITKSRTNTFHMFFYDKLRGGIARLVSSSTESESDVNTNYLGANAQTFGMDGVTIPGGYSEFGSVSHNFLDMFFRRYPGVFDVVCYTGTGSSHTENHNLGVAPELSIVKERSNISSWEVDATGVDKHGWMEITDAFSAGHNSTFTSTGIVLSGSINNTNGRTFVAYLFATLAGVSKVGTYTGNGTTQTINCGFTAGARFVLMKCTSNIGDWFVWDSTRGIVAGADSYLKLASTDPESTDDTIDPDNSGFIVNCVEASLNQNANGRTYIYLALS
ncbi:MAG: hypothetical protein Q7S01_00520 [bacterium]|nr:hypothetical protein [bacterium]